MKHGGSGFIGGFGGVNVGRRSGVCRRSRGRSVVKAVTGLKNDLGFKDVDDKVVKAVESLGDRRVTVADVAARAGTQVSTTERELLQLSQLTGGKLEVSNDGDILYTFDGNVRRALSQSSFRAAVRQQFEKYWPVLFYLIRISFGLFLFLSILIVFTAISVLSQSSDRDSRDRRDYGSYYSTGPRFFGPDLFDVFYWSTFRSRYYDVEPRPAKMNFLESIFSFVFGDGNPNQGLEEKKWRAVAGAIRANDGAVTAEQLAPFLDPAGSSNADSDAYRDESFVIPAMLKFQGHPEVTADGDIIYLFPEMTKSGANIDMVSDPKGRYIEESEWEFSKAEMGSKVAAGLLGAVNLGGVLTLGRMLSSPATLQGASPAMVASINAIFPLLFSYAATYAAVPLFRWLWIRRQNVGIRIRNALRKTAATLLLRPSESLRRKEAAARQFASSRTTFSDSDVSFSSDADSRPSDDDMLSDFDRKLSR